ncbi:MAG: AbrB/MazE/SpoVT family DNA-binding domain-containing protein [Gallionella sp.]|nr:AbrB/MazE/SpoVT family DNA-binding domain-containing protein [Gallionella sp.]
MKTLKRVRQIQESIMIVTVSEKGQLVIPAKIRRLLGITPGTRLNVLPDAGGFRALVDDARKTKRATDCVGIAGYTGPAIPADQMDAAQYATKP